MNWEVRAMRSATPFFDSALYRKTMARFWPLWAGWGLLLTFLVPLQLVDGYLDGVRDNGGLESLISQAVDLPAMAQAMVVIQLFLCVLCTMAAFSYLYNNRSACMMHALPMRREKLFGTQYLAGISMVILPELAVSVLTLLLELALVPSEYWGQTLTALGTLLLAVLAQAVAFYSIAVFCAMFTGHILALPVFYGVVNFIVVGLFALTQALCNMFLFGFSNLPNEDWAMNLSPAVALSYASHWNTYWENDVKVSVGFQSPETLGVYVVVGLILSVLALFIYRRRHVESAGDVVAVPLVRPIFRAGVALCCGLCLGAFTGALLSFGDSRASLCLMVTLWTLVGYVAAEMLLKKSFHVFKGCWKGAAAVTAVSALVCAGCYFDWMGVETRVPDGAQVANLSGAISMGAPWDSGGDLALGGTDDSDALREKVVALHQAIVDDYEQNGWPDPFHPQATGNISVVLNYRLDNGRSLNRRYYLPLYQEDLEKEGTLTHAVQDLLSDREVVRKAYDFERYEGQTLAAVKLQTVAWTQKPTDESRGDKKLDQLSGAQRAALWQAVRQDFDEGNIGVRWAIAESPQRYANTYQTDLSFYFQDVNRDESREESAAHYYGDRVTVEYEGYDNHFTITLTPQAAHTLALLEEYNVWEDCQLKPWPHFEEP